MEVELEGIQKKKKQKTSAGGAEAYKMGAKAVMRVVRKAVMVEKGNGRKGGVEIVRCDLLGK